MDLITLVKEMLGLPPDAADEMVVAALAKAMGAATPEKKEDAPMSEADPAVPTTVAANVAALAAPLRPVTDPGVVALAARIDRIEAAEKRAAVEALVTANRSKIPDVMLSWARSCDEPTLRRFLAAAPEVYAAHVQPAGRGASGEPGAVTLSALDASMSGMCGTKADRIAKIRARDAQKGRAA